jgi:hypothetical protein
LKRIGLCNPVNGYKKLLIIALLLPMTGCYSFGRGIATMKTFLNDVGPDAMT